MMQDYTIRDIIDYRKISWNKSDEFFYLTAIPKVFEEYALKPNYFSYGLLQSGSIKIEVDHKDFLIKGHSLLVYRPNQIIRILDIEPGTKGSFILFTKQFLDYLNENIFSVSKFSFLSYQFDSCVHLSALDYYQLKDVFRKIFDLIIGTSSERWEYIARNLISVLVYETQDVLENYKKKDISTGTTSGSMLSSNFKKLVAEHYKSMRNISYYAAELNISINYLHKLIKKQTGSTPAAIINLKLMNEAKSLLSYTHLNISEIAYELNFSDVYAFSKFFKKQTGISPSLFRQDIQLTLN